MIYTSNSNSEAYLISELVIDSRKKLNYNKSNFKNEQNPLLTIMKRICFG